MIAQTPTCYGYFRQPLNPSKGSDNTRESLEAYCQQRLGHCTLGGLLEDDAGFASVALMARPAGKLFHQMLTRGDHAVIADSATAFISAREFTDQMRLWLGRGIHVHLLDLGIDTSAPGGQIAMHIALRCHEAETRRKSDQGCVRNSKAKEIGRPTNGRSPLGTKLIGKRGSKTLVLDIKERAVMQEIVRLKDDQKLSWKQVSDSIESRLAAHEGREFIDSAFYKRQWDVARCRRAYAQEKQLQATVSS